MKKKKTMFEGIRKTWNFNPCSKTIPSKKIYKRVKSNNKFFEI